MNNAGVLDDYLEQLLGDAVPASAAAGIALEAQALPAGPEPADDSAPTAQAGFIDLLDEVRNDPSLSGTMGALAEDEARPGWDDLPHEVVYETDAIAAPPAEAGAEAPALDMAAPGLADLLAEVLNDSALTGAMSLAVPAAAVEPPVAAAAAPTAAPMPAPAPPPPVPTPAPTARALPPPGPTIYRGPAPLPVRGARPSSWEELQAQARDPASSPRENRRAAERTSRWLRLRCGAQAYALELLKVQEVVLPVPLLPLRGTSPAMLGIMNLRGQVVPVMDLGIHLGAGAAGNDANTRIVVLEEDGETMGLRVTAVEDVANLTESQIEPPDTARICQISNDLFRGVARVSAQPMILLDASQLLG